MSTGIKNNSDIKRTTWSNQFEFILTLIGFAVGLGSIWKFPYLCYKNRGGAFLIPYFICLVIIGIPLFCLEINFGQFASLGPIKAWAITPAMRGVGVAMVIIPAIISLYYSVIIGYCFYYFFASMTSTMPWSSCENEWNTCNCHLWKLNLSQHENVTHTECDSSMEETAKSSTNEYFYNLKVLNITKGIEEAGSVKWDIALCNLLVWVIVWIVLSKGVESLGKVMYFTAIFPYVMLTVLLIKGITLEGYSDGLYYYMSPDFSKLLDANVWGDAATQIFYSLSTCMGGLVALGSYNKFNHNAVRDAFLVPVINSMTSLYAGLAIFSVLGHMAFKLRKPVSQVALPGPGLVFEVYPEGLSSMPFPPIWCVLFFFMMATLGLSSQFSLVETYLTAVEDYLTSFLNKPFKKIIFRGICCMLGFLLGLPMVTEGGFYMFNLLESQMSGFPLLIIGFFEVFSICYFYGVRRFASDIEMMIGQTLFSKASLIYFKVFWVVFTPLCLLATIVFKFWHQRPLALGDYHYPLWAETLAWLTAFFPIIMIPIWFVGVAFKNGLVEFFRKMIAPEDAWRPSRPEDRVGTHYDSQGNNYIGSIESLVNNDCWSRESLDDKSKSNLFTDDTFKVGTKL